MRIIKNRWAPDVTLRVVTGGITPERRLLVETRQTLKMSMVTLRSSLFSIACGVTLLFTPVSTHSQTVVTSNLDNGSPGTLRYVIQHADSGDVITFAPTVRGTIILQLGQLSIEKDLTILGPGMDLLEISGNDLSRVVRIDSSQVSISGLTLTRGLGPYGDRNGGCGGALVSVASHVHLDLVRVSSSRAGSSEGYGGGGGGICVVTGYLLVERSVIVGNQAGRPSGVGGGVVVSRSVTQIRSSVIEDNKAAGCLDGTFCVAGDGGGIYVWGELDVDQSIIRNNSAGDAPLSIPGGIGGSGGGIYGDEAELLVRRTQVHGNRAGRGGVGPAGYLVPGGTGGGIYFKRGYARIAESSVTNNQSGDGGTPSGAAGAGGGIYLRSARATIEKSTISGNRTGDSAGGQRGVAGGVVMDFDNWGFSTLELSSVTIAGNEGLVGGLVVFQGVAPLSLTNSLIADNLDTTNPGESPGLDCGLLSDVTTSTFNLGVVDRGCPTGPGSILVKPKHIGRILEPLADNGGPTPTHALHPSSPAIDAGYCPDDLTDQRGYGNPDGGRAIDLGKKDPDTACDIGAFEFRAVPVVVAETVQKVASNEHAGSVPGFSLSALYPNPSAGVSRSDFEVPESQEVRVALFDVLGREVRIIFDAFVEEGRRQEISISTHGLPAGSYFLRLSGKSGILLRTLVIAR